MKKIKYLLLLLTITYSYLSCKKIPAANENYSIVYIDQQLKDFYNYDVGSYWVYKDVLTGDIDSFVVVNFANNKEGLTATAGQNTEGTLIVVYDYNITTTIPTYRTKYSWDLRGHAASLHFYYQYNSSQYVIDYGFGTIPFVLFDTVSYLNVPNCLIDTVSNGKRYLPQYVMDTASYADVYLIYVKSNTLMCKNLIPQNDTFYINKQVGIMKMVLNNYAQYSWQLLRNHIIIKY